MPEFPKKKMHADAVTFAARRWAEGYSAQAICDDLKSLYEIVVTRQAIQNLARRNRSRFPERSREEINDMISYGMRIAAGEENASISAKAKLKPKAPPAAPVDWD